MSSEKYIPPYRVSGKAMNLIAEIAAAIERYRIILEGPASVGCSSTSCSTRFCGLSRPRARRMSLPTRKVARKGTDSRAAVTFSLVACRQGETK